MYPVSPEFKAAVRGPHKATVRAEVWRGGVFLRSLQVLDGSVDIDARRAQRRTCRVRLAAQRPSVRLDPIWNTYRSIRGVVVEWGTATSTWDGAAPHTWAEGNFIPTSQEAPEYPTYGDLSGGYADYAALQFVVGYDEVQIDEGIIPTTAFSDVAPFGNELRLWRGVEVERPLFYTYQNIKGLRMTWDLVSASLTWATVTSTLTWADGNDLPI